MVHGLQQIGRNHPLRAVAVHPQFFGNDAAFPANRRAGKVGRCNKIQQYLQRLGKIFGTAEVVCCFIKAGKGIGRSPQRIKALHGVSIGAVEHLVFQIVCYTGREVYFPPPHPVADIDGTHPDRQHGIGGNKAGHPAHLHRKAAGQCDGAGALAQQFGGMPFILPHRTHPPSLWPARKILYPV